MNINLLFSCLIFFWVNTFNTRVNAQTWTQKAAFGGPARFGAVAFSDGVSGYMGTGQNASNNYTSDFWKYNPANNTWTQVAAFPAEARCCATAFAINTKGYVALGWDGQFPIGVKEDFWEYNTVANTWTQKAVFSGGGREFAAGFSIGAKGYIGTGYDNTFAKNDFWEYDPSSDTWTQKATFAGGLRQNATAFSIGNKGYIGTGFFATAQKDFWEYDQAANTWTKKADFGGGSVFNAVGFSIGNKGYIGTGFDGSVNKKDFWEFNPASNTWTAKSNFGGTARSAASGFSIGNSGYIGTGDDGNKKNDFWQYTISVGIEDHSRAFSKLTVYSMRENIVLLYDFLSAPNSPISFTLIDLNGREILQHDLNIRSHSVKIPSGNIASGIYFYRISAGTHLLASGKVAKAE